MNFFMISLQGNCICVSWYMKLICADESNDRFIFFFLFSQICSCSLLLLYSTVFVVFFIRSTVKAKSEIVADT